MLDDKVVLEALAFAFYVAEGVADDQYHDHAGDEYKDYADILRRLNVSVGDYCDSSLDNKTPRGFLLFLEGK